LPFSSKTWIRDSLEQRGVWGTLAHWTKSAFELVRDLAPGRRRRRYGDLDYDWEHRVDTTWSIVGLRTRLCEALVDRQYQPSEPELFRQVIGGLPIACDQFTFVDLGSGKGRALLLASEFPFRRIIGVELLPELHSIAHQNVARFQDSAQQGRTELWLGDARDFAFPAGPLLVFLFDPFPEHILQQVMKNLERSLRESPRPLVVVYENPISEHVLSAAGWLRRVNGDVRCAVYEARNVLGDLQPA
jgi:SAM-dependent methyltransferase